MQRSPDAGRISARGRYATLVAVLAISLALAVPLPARADCATLIESGWEHYELVFTGTTLEQDRETARFEVSQVWQGPDLASVVQVKTGTDQPPWPVSVTQYRASSTDADLVEGRSYLIGIADPERFEASICTISEATPTVLATAPSDVRAPTSDGLKGVEPSPFDGPAGALALLAALAAMAGGAVLWRRRVQDRTTVGGNQNL